MTEAEWLACAEPDEMLVLLNEKANSRKLRLCCCGFVRRVWHQLMRVEESRRAVEIAEEFADGQCSEQDLSSAMMKADRAMEIAFNFKEKRAFGAAVWCAQVEIDALGLTR